METKLKTQLSWAESAENMHASFELFLDSKIQKNSDMIAWFSFFGMKRINFCFITAFNPVWFTFWLESFGGGGRRRIHNRHTHTHICSRVRIPAGAVGYVFFFSFFLPLQSILLCWRVFSVFLCYRSSTLKIVVILPKVQVTAVKHVCALGGFLFVCFCFLLLFFFLFLFFLFSFFNLFSISFHRWSALDHS